MKLSALDQSFSRSYHAAPQALQDTISMAQHCETLGLERFWVSEHHAFHLIAGSSPEVLLAAIGAATSHITLGSGGIMLPHYSPYKIAEQFSLLANLYSNRINLGVGRAPGADMSTAAALARSGRPNFHDFIEQIEQLSEYLWNEDTKPLVSPKPPADLSLWMLGSSADSAALAAHRGLPYNLGAFINGTVQPSIMHYYRNNFQASALQTEPYAILAMSVFCAETEEEARAHQKTSDVNFYRFITGQANGQYLPMKDALNFPEEPQFNAFILQREVLRAVGTPEQVQNKIETIAKEFKVDEIMAVTNMAHIEDRKKSFSLLAHAFD